jgi:hypothetical protein
MCAFDGVLNCYFLRWVPSTINLVEKVELFHVGFVGDKWQWDRFYLSTSVSPVNFISPVLHYLEKWKKTDHFFFILIKRFAQ